MAIRATRTAADSSRAASHTNAPAGRFRFTGKGKHFVGSGEDVRRVKPGEVIELTVGQAEAFADKFERVEEPASV